MTEQGELSASALKAQEAKRALRNASKNIVALSEQAETMSKVMKFRAKEMRIWAQKIGEGVNILEYEDRQYKPKALQKLLIDAANKLDAEAI